MNNIIDYLDWRGDIEFGYCELNEVDGLIFSQLSYLNFGMLKGEMTISELFDKYSKINFYKKIEMFQPLRKD